MSADRHLFLWLTREEFLWCWALVTLANAEGYPDHISEFATSGEEGATDSYFEEFCRAVRFLEKRCEHQFSAIRVDEAGRILAQTREPIQPQNIAFLRLFQFGRVPNYIAGLTSIIVAIETGKLRGLDLDPFREALADIEDSIREAKGAVTRKSLESYRKNLDTALAGVGVRRLPTCRDIVN